MLVTDTVKRKTFESLKSRNYRLYIFGQLISASGTWMQTVALSWLVLKLTGSGVDLGTVLAAQFVPVLLLGPLGGLIADRVNKRKLILLTQSSLAVASFALGILTLTGSIKMWMVYLISVSLGIINSADNPARQSFVIEMVGKDDVANAVSLNAVVMNSARIVGPGIAGLLIYIVGIGPLFITNAASFIAVILALAFMRSKDLKPAVRLSRSRGQLREGFIYVWSNKDLRVPLIMMVLVGTLAYEFQVSLPLLAHTTFGKGAGTYAAFTALMGAGAVVGGLLAATFPFPNVRRLSIAALGFGALILAVAMMPSATWAMISIVPMGAVSIIFISIANSSLQLNAAPAMRGRVMALYTVAFLGSTPVGAPIVGYIGQHFGPRYSVAIGGMAAIVAGLYGIIYFRMSNKESSLAKNGEGSVVKLTEKEDGLLSA